MLKINFNLREVTKKGETPIRMILRWNGYKLVVSTRMKVKPQQWNREKNMPVAVRSILYAELTELERRTFNCFEILAQQLERQPNTIELGNVLNDFFNTKENEQGKKKVALELMEYIEQHIADAKTQINPKTKRLIAESTIRAYNQCKRLLNEYQKEKRVKLVFNSIDLDFYKDFKSFLQNKPYNVNTTGKHIQTLKVFLNAAIDKDLTTNSKHTKKAFKADKVSTDSIYLNEKELSAIFSLYLEHKPKLERARDLFLVGCYTGLRFSDYNNIKPENIEGDFITIKTQKTAEIVTIPIHSVLSAIMDKYKGKTANSLPKSISNVKLNEYIKEVCALVESLQLPIQLNGIVKPKCEFVTTHTARRSFATNVYKQGVPAQTIMKITGHRTERAFMTYLKLNDKEHAQLLANHWKELKLKTQLKIVS